MPVQHPIVVFAAIECEQHAGHDAARRQFGIQDGKRGSSVAVADGVDM
jgi:hypothetical protein